MSKVNSFSELNVANHNMLSMNPIEQVENPIDHEEFNYCPVCGQKDSRLSEGTHRCRTKHLKKTPLIIEHRSLRSASYNERLNEGFRLLRMRGDV